MTQSADYIERVYHIEFNTETNPPYIRAVKVTIAYDLMGEKDVMDISLCDDRLYKALEKYVLMNPSRKRKAKA